MERARAKKECQPVASFHFHLGQSSVTGIFPTPTKETAGSDERLPRRDQHHADSSDRFLRQHRKERSETVARGRLPGEVFRHRDGQEQEDLRILLESSLERAQDRDLLGRHSEPRRRSEGYRRRTRHHSSCRSHSAMEREEPRNSPSDQRRGYAPPDSGCGGARSQAQIHLHEFGERLWAQDVGSSSPDDW